MSVLRSRRPLFVVLVAAVLVALVTLLAPVASVGVTVPIDPTTPSDTRPGPAPVLGSGPGAGEPALGVATMRHARAGALQPARTERILVILARVNGRTDATTQTSMARTVRQMGRGLQIVSGGRITVAQRVTPWLRLGQSIGCGRTERIFSLAVGAAQRAGFRPQSYLRGAYDHVMVYFAPCGRIGWAGYAEWPGSRMWINGARDVGVIGHEYLHNVGLGHNGSLECTRNGVPVSLSVNYFDDCEGFEYGDPYDVMGGAYAMRLSAYNRLSAGWLPPRHYQEISGGTTTVRLRAPGSALAGRQLVRFRRYHDYFLEFEPTEGVVVRTDQFPAFGAGIAIVDTTPVDPDGYGDWDGPRWAIPAGQSWTAPRGVRVTVLSADESGAVVRIAYGTPAPTVPAAPVAPTVAENLNEGTVRAVIAGPPADTGMVVHTYRAEFDYGDHVEVVDGYRHSTPLPGSGYPAFVETWVDEQPLVRVRVRAINEVGASAWSEWTDVAPVP